jgi:hypothetical protein
MTRDLHFASYVAKIAPDAQKHLCFNTGPWVRPRRFLAIGSIQRCSVADIFRSSIAGRYHTGKKMTKSGDTKRIDGGEIVL